MDGCFTEKLWDALAAGTISIYLGMPSPDRYLDTDSFIAGEAYFDELTDHFDTDSLLSNLAAMPDGEIERYQRSGQAMLKIGLRRRWSNRDRLTADL